MTLKTGKWIVDASVWLDIFDSLTSPAIGLLEGAERIIPASTVLEVVSVSARRGKDAAHAAVSLRSQARIVPLTGGLAEHAGMLHAELRRMRPKLSTADAVLIVLSREMDVPIMTFDTDFRGLPGVTVLKKGKR